MSSGPLGARIGKVAAEIWQNATSFALLALPYSVGLHCSRAAVVYRAPESRTIAHSPKLSRDEIESCY